MQTSLSANHSARSILAILFLKKVVTDVFSSCSFIPRAYFEARLAMVSYYCHEIWRHKYQVVKPLLSENACFFNFFQQ